jgi:hypothetical protein
MNERFIFKEILQEKMEMVNDNLDPCLPADRLRSHPE